MGSLHPDLDRNPDLDPGGQKLPTKIEKNVKKLNFEVLDVIF
jgi:hypothetical protein